MKNIITTRNTMMIEKPDTRVLSPLSNFLLGSNRLVVTHSMMYATKMAVQKKSRMMIAKNECIGNDLWEGAFTPHPVTDCCLCGTP